MSCRSWKRTARRLFLRLRHHVARGELTPEDVSVGYVYVAEDGSPTIKNLQIDELEILKRDAIGVLRCGSA